jgi:hypothetical protein
LTEAGKGKVEAGYNPDQPRDPGGDNGGQWVKDGGNESRVLHEYIGGDDWQKDMRTSVKIGEDEVAFADWDYDKFEKIPRLKMIEVTQIYRRKGIATQLIKDIMKNIGSSKIEWTYPTDEGEALRNSLEKSGIVFNDPDSSD